MDVKTSQPASFTLFPTLPPELREQIWLAALPNNVERAMYFYKRGCWAPRLLVEGDPEYHPWRPDMNLWFDFDHDSLDRPRIETPLVLVNEEARRIALAWARTQRFAICQKDNVSAPVFERGFGPETDVMFVARDSWNEFLCEPYDRSFEPDMIERHFTCDGTSLNGAAIHIRLLQDEGMNALLELFDFYSNITQLFIIVGEEPILSKGDDGMKAQKAWELENTQEKALVWDSVGEVFKLENSEAGAVDGETPHPLLKEASEQLVEELSRYGNRRFEIRLASAVERLN